MDWLHPPFSPQLQTYLIHLHGSRVGSVVCLWETIYKRPFLLMKKIGFLLRLHVKIKENTQSDIQRPIINKSECSSVIVKRNEV